jgi:hypothetical protein
MNLTETLRQALSTPASGHWPANPTCAERMIQRLIDLALGQDDVDAIRLIFERVDGPVTSVAATEHAAAMREAAAAMRAMTAACVHPPDGEPAIGPRELEAMARANCRTIEAARRAFGVEPPAVDPKTDDHDPIGGWPVDCLPLDHPEVEAMRRAHPEMETIGRAVDPKDDGGTWMDD